MVGLSLIEAMQQLHPDGDDTLHREITENYKNAFFQMRVEKTVHEPMFDGIAACIDTLENAGWLLGVATGKSDRGLTAVLAEHRITERFVTLHTADRHPSKPHPSMLEACMADAGAVPETSVMIGDTSFDMAMAKAANIMAIGVGWGYHPPQELDAAGADIVVDHPRDIALAIEELG